MYYASSLQKKLPYFRVFLKVNMASISVCILIATPAFSQSSSELDKTAFSVHFATDYSFAAHRSDAMNATDFGAEYGVSLATWAGKKKNIGLALSQRHLSTKFSQVDSSMSTSWTEASAYYRFYWFYPYVSLGHGTLEAKRNGTDLSDAMCSTAGGGLDIHIPAGSNVVAQLGMKSTAALDIHDRLGALSTMRPIQQYDAGVDINPKLTWMTLQLGFRYRSYVVDLGQPYKEIQTGPFVGMNFHQDF